MGSRTPITLITGFLGSGKTTLLRELLTDPEMGETAVLVNGLGEIALDHHLLSRIDERTVVMASGCVCCTIRADLADELRDLEARRARGEIPGYERVVIETTGLADPAPILSTLLRTRWSRRSTASTGSSRPSTPSTASPSCTGSRRPRSRPRWPTGS